MTKEKLMIKYHRFIANNNSWLDCYEGKTDKETVNLIEKENKIYEKFIEDLKKLEL